VEELARVVAQAKADYDIRAGRLAELQARLQECDAEIAAARKDKDALESRREEISVEKRRLNHK